MLVTCRPCLVRTASLALAACYCAAVSNAASPPLEVFATSDAIRVFEDGVGGPD